MSSETYKVRRPVPALKLKEKPSLQRINTAFDRTDRGYRLWIRCRVTEMMLATKPGNPDIHREYIAEKAPTAERTEADIADHAASVEQLVDKEKNIFYWGKFYVTEDGQYYDYNADDVPDEIREKYEPVLMPFIHDYQWRGAFKESIAMLARADGGKAAAKGKNKDEVYACSSITAYKKTVDGGWFIDEHCRRIPLFIPETYLTTGGEAEDPMVYVEDENGKGHWELKTDTRTLRINNPSTGVEMNVLTTSEFVPAGTEYFFGIHILNRAHKDALIECLDFKRKVGMLQWRGGGKGTLEWWPCTQNGEPFMDKELAEIAIEYGITTMEGVLEMKAKLEAEKAAKKTKK